MYTRKAELSVYKHCAICGRPFAVFRCRLKRRASMFCTQRCHRIARSLFRRMLEDGRLTPLLHEMLAELQMEWKAGRSSQLMRDVNRAYVNW